MKTSLDSDALGEIAGHVDVTALADGNVIGQQLQRDGGNDWRKTL